MSRRILWAPEARADFAGQIRHIAKDSPKGARLVKDRVDEAVRSLQHMPVGTPGRVFGTYEKYVLKKSLIAVFEIPDENTLAILRIIHTSRDWPEGQWPVSE